MIASGRMGRIRKNEYEGKTVIWEEEMGVMTNLWVKGAKAQGKTL